MKKQPGERVKAAGILLMISAEPSGTLTELEKSPSQFLLMRHHNRWDLPKGHSEVGETFRQTALRETEEETGIAARSIAIDPNFCFELVYPVTYARWGDQIFEKQVRFFLGFIAEKPTLHLTEHESAEWFDWNPPHRIQARTIDPLLAAVAQHLQDKDGLDHRNGAQF